MQISKKADYALRAMAILASLPTDKSIQAQELADAGRIPIKFLEQILLTLKRADLLVSKRGAGGGYRLGRESRLISVGEVIEAVEGGSMRFLDNEVYPEFVGSTGIKRCLQQAEDAVNKHLNNTSIEDLVRREVGDAMVGYGI